MAWPRPALRELWHRPPGQLAALDALRSLAVLLVIFGHAANEHVREAGSDDRFARLPFVRGGFIGVDLFFVLSGYFIGRQLWREVVRTKTVRIGRFMLRRGFRIWPLYFFFIVFVLAVLRRGDFPFGAWWSDPLFLTNYVNRGVVMGSWSLCTEEQFYIVTPLAMYVATRAGVGLKRLRVGLVALLIGLPLLRALIYLHYTGSLAVHDPDVFHEHLYFQFHTHADGLVMGLLLSNVEVDTGDAHARGLFSHAWVIGLALVACLGLQRLQREVLDFTAVTLLFGSMTWYLVCRGGRSEGPLLRVLDGQIFYLVSRLSFGMYLNHEYMLAPIMRALAKVPFGPPALHDLASAVIAATISALVAVATFVLIEHPFLALRGRVLTESHQKG